MPFFDWNVSGKYPAIDSVWGAPWKLDRVGSVIQSTLTPLLGSFDSTYEIFVREATKVVWSEPISIGSVGSSVLWNCSRLGAGQLRYEPLSNWSISNCFNIGRPVIIDLAVQRRMERDRQITEACRSLSDRVAAAQAALTTREAPRSLTTSQKRSALKSTSRYYRELVEIAESQAEDFDLEQAQKLADALILVLFVAALIQASLRRQYSYFFNRRLPKNEGIHIPTYAVFGEDQLFDNLSRDLSRRNCEYRPSFEVMAA